MAEYMGGIVKCRTCEYHCAECDKIRKEERSHGSVSHHNPGDSLCWCCKKAIPSEEYYCSYSRDLVPVDHWVAKKRITKEGAIQYNVLSCPEFERGR